MSLATQLQNLATRIGTEFKTVYGRIGTLASLSTTEKGSLVGAINEVAADVASGGGAPIDDVTPSASKVYSSQKTQALADGKPNLNDTVASTTTVYSSTKTDSQIATAVAAKPSINDSTASGTAVYSSSKVNSQIAAATAALPAINDSTASTTSLYSSSKVNAAITAAVDGKVVIDDAGPATDKTYSSSKIGSEISSAVAAIVDGSPASLDTLHELAAALGSDPNFATTMSDALGNRVRVDELQMFTEPQRVQGRMNLDVLGKAEIGNPEADLVATFVAALV